MRAGIDRNVVKVRRCTYMRQRGAEFRSYPGKCRDLRVTACPSPFLFPLLVSTATTQDCNFTPASTIPQPKSTIHPQLLPPTPAGNLVPAITDDIFPAHSGSRALLSVSCFLGYIVGSFLGPQPQACGRSAMNLFAFAFGIHHPWLTLKRR
jgi:hypothetical protein